MGNQTSEFEQQFFKMYNFVAVMDESYFKQVKIYRKIKFAFNYIMIVESGMLSLRAAEEGEIKHYIKERLGLIRKYQNEWTSKLEYFHLLEDKALNCSSPLIKMYIQYYSYTLHHYLNALRISKFNFSIEELVFVIRSLAQAILTLRKMKLVHFKIHLNNIFVSAEMGKVVINPIHFLYEEIDIPAPINHFSNPTYIPAHPHINYEHYSNQDQILQLQRRQLQNIQQIFVQMTRYLNIKDLNQIHYPYSILKGLTKVRQILQIFKTNVQQLNVDQFCQPDESNYQLYDLQSKPNK